jgi:hypothetical protein
MGTRFAASVETYETPQKVNSLGVKISLLLPRKRTIVGFGSIYRYHSVPQETTLAGK